MKKLFLFLLMGIGLIASPGAAHAKPANCVMNFEPLYFFYITPDGTVNFTRDQTGVYFDKWECQEVPDDSENSGDSQSASPQGN